MADDRFTPPPKPGSREYLDARKLFKFTATIGERGANDRTDVGKIEALLYMAGVFDLDGTNGPTGYYGERLKQAVKAFQKARGLRVDGDVGPKGETIRTLAQHLQGLGRWGDKVLAHLTPAEAKFLHDNTDGGSINPDTGLMEFNIAGEDADEKKGTYIWRTVGDNRVRSEHAVRDGKTFSWDNPPDGGHPGEAPNCRCTAEEPDCTKQWLEHREIVKELAPLSGKLSNLEKEISNLKILIEKNKAAIEILKKIETALLMGAAATRFPNPYVKIAGYASDVAAVIVGVKIREIEAEMQGNIAKLQPLEKEHPILEEKVRALIARKELAKQNYNECMGI